MVTGIIGDFDEMFFFRLCEYASILLAMSAAGLASATLLEPQAWRRGRRLKNDEQATRLTTG